MDANQKLGERNMRNRDKGLHRCLVPVLSFTLVVLFSTSLAFAQTGNLNRPFEPVILNGSSFPGYSGNVAPISQLFLYKYNSGENTWQQIPLQIDEMERDTTSNDTTYFFPGDGLLDDLDELSFMARDAGDKAPANNWLTDASSRVFERYEVELEDQLATGNKGYVYLYRSTTLSDSPTPADYVTYVPPPAGSGTDTIRGKSYVEGHLPNGLNNSLLVPGSADGSGMNFLDRLKLRFQISILGIPIPINEDAFMLLGTPNVRDGRVRIIRELRERIQVATATLDFPILIQYYGYSSVLSTRVNLTNVPIPVNLLRQSFDFNSSVTGAKWHNQNLTNAITINGNSGNLSPTDAAIVNAPRLNWYMLSSQHGSFVNIFSLPAGLGNAQRFYFHDQPSGTNDGTPDTGENGSFGDSGLLITGTNISGVFQLALISYFLGKDQPRSVGETMRNQTEKPLVFNVQSQNFTVGVKEANNLSPRRFALQQNSPNPVLRAQPQTSIRYELPWSEPMRVELHVYNLLGQKIRELVNALQGAGFYEVRWDGRLENGKVAPPGIYFYQLRAGAFSETKKLLIY
jgi:hypothetical protein